MPGSLAGVNPGSLPVSAPRRVHDLLTAAPDGPRRVLHRGPDAVYVDVDGTCVGVVSSRAAQVPCALRAATTDLTGVPGLADGPAEIRAGVLHLGGTAMRVGRFVDVSVPGLAPGAGPARQAAPAPVDPEVTEMVTQVGWTHARLTAATVARLVGRGGGLTPLGDDLLCGWLATHRAAGVPTPQVDTTVRARLPHTTLLSATLLQCALAGEVLDEFAAYLTSLNRADTAGEHAAAQRLIRIGHTSGAGLYYGAQLALTELGQQVAA